VTDGDGRFVLNGVGGYETGIAISTPALDLWVHKPVPVRGQFCEIILPAAAKLVLRYNIEGGEPEATMSIFLVHDGRNEAVNAREVKVANGGNIVLDHLMPGSCHVWRRKTVQIADAKRSLRLESQSVVLESGKTSELTFTRDLGMAVEGEIIGLAQLKLPGALIFVVKPESLDLIVFNNRVDEATEALKCDATGRFKTPRLRPGNYVIVAESYKPKTQGQLFGAARPAEYRASAELTVPEQGEAPQIRLLMRPVRQDDGPNARGAGAR
jgi:hypothetical protein